MNKCFVGSWLVFILSFLMACGPKVDPTDTKAVSEAAISSVDQDIPLQQSPVLGTLPSLYARLRAGEDSVNKLTIVDENMSREKRDKINNARWDAKELVKDHYAALITKEKSTLINKEIPVSFDSNEFSEGKITVSENLSIGEIKVHVEMVFARSVSTFQDRGGKLELLDSEGNVIRVLTGYRKLLADCRIPGTDLWSVEVGPGKLWYTYFDIDLRDAGLASIRVSFN